MVSIFLEIRCSWRFSGTSRNMSEHILETQFIIEFHANAFLVSGIQVVRFLLCNAL